MAIFWVSSFLVLRFWRISPLFGPKDGKESNTDWLCPRLLFFLSCYHNLASTSDFIITCSPLGESGRYNDLIELAEKTSRSTMWLPGLLC